MKARVKATGEIFDIENVSLRLNGKVLSSFGLDDLEVLLPDLTPDYWTRLEHQYAGMAMQGILANIDLLMSLAKKKADDYPAKYTVTEFAKDCAHALVEKMKEKEVRK